VKSMGPRPDPSSVVSYALPGTREGKHRSERGICPYGAKARPCLVPELRPSVLQADPLPGFLDRDSLFAALLSIISTHLPWLRISRAPRSPSSAAAKTAVIHRMIPASSSSSSEDTSRPTVTMSPAYRNPSRAVTSRVIHRRVEPRM
jgi:hypothetical protein